MPGGVGERQPRLAENLHGRSRSRLARRVARNTANESLRRVGLKQQVLPRSRQTTQRIASAWFGGQQLAHGIRLQALDRLQAIETFVIEHARQDEAVGCRQRADLKMESATWRDPGQI